MNDIPGVVLYVGEPEGVASNTLLLGPESGEFADKVFEGFWRPEEGELISFEAELAEFVRQNPPSKLAGISSWQCSYDEADLMSDLLANSFRQYAGVIAGGKRFIHVTGVGGSAMSAWLVDQESIPDFPRNYISFSDSGPTSFVAVYDSETRAIVSFRYDVYYSGHC